MSTRERHADAIPDRVQTLEDVQRQLRSSGMRQCELIIGVDFTISNSQQGKRTFGGRSLHCVAPAAPAALAELPVRRLKDLSMEHGVDVSRCVEKADLLSALGAAGVALQNPYERAIRSIARTLAPFDSDQQVRVESSVLSLHLPALPRSLLLIILWCCRSQSTGSAARARTASASLTSSRAGGQRRGWTR